MDYIKTHKPESMSLINKFGNRPLGNSIGVLLGGYKYVVLIFKFKIMAHKIGERIETKKKIILVTEGLSCNECYFFEMCVKLHMKNDVKQITGGCGKDNPDQKSFGFKVIWKNSSRTRKD